MLESLTTVYVVPLIVAVSPAEAFGHLQVPESKTMGAGHDPQLGVLLSLNCEKFLKLDGWEEIFPTHQPDIS